MAKRRILVLDVLGEVRRALRVLRRVERFLVQQERHQRRREANQQIRTQRQRETEQEMPNHEI